MARLTVEDCLDNVENRFELVIIAAQRARQLAMGAEPLVPEDNDKPTVLALREIAENLINKEILKQQQEEASIDDIEAMIEGDLSAELQESLKETLADSAVADESAVAAAADTAAAEAPASEDAAAEPAASEADGEEQPGAAS